MSKKEESIFRVYVKERRGNFRIAISKKDFTTRSMAEKYFDDLLLDEKRTGNKIIELQFFNSDRRCETLKEVHI